MSPKLHSSTLSRALLPALFLAWLAPAAAVAQKKPKPALSGGAARRVIAATPGFKLNTGAVKIREVGPAGSAPVSVVAEVTEAFRLAWVEDESAPQTSGVFKQKRWRAVEFRTGDRTWEEFDLLAAPVGAARLEGARRALEELVAEFDARQRASTRKNDDAGGAKGDGKDKDQTKGEGKGKDKNKDKDKGKNKDKDKNENKDKDKNKDKSVEPLMRGPLTIKQLSLMGSSAVAEVVVEATFSLSKDERGRWSVTEVVLGGEEVGDFEALRRSVNSQKAARARADLAALGVALEAFKRERGSYVVADDSVALLDYLSPRYVKQIIRLDPWHNPYRYAGTAAGYTLGSDGPDGKPGTADDVTLTGG
ncbi:MAG: Type secretion system protein [Acidobacteriota bacterium]|nr:Type secretion system protein [Acidobacteriota bacterium]